MRNQFTPEQEQVLRAWEEQKYPQASNFLWVEEGGVRGYCCLGAAAMELCPNSPLMKSDGCTSKGEVAPATVVKRMRLRGNVGDSFVSGNCLSALNDRGKTHPEIAAIVRSNPHEYFTNFDAPEES